MKKRLISLLLAVSMVLTFLPIGAVSAFADDEIDSDKGVLLKGGETIDETMVQEKGTIYQLRGSYSEPIEIWAPDITINITDTVEYDIPTTRDAFLIYVRRSGDQVGDLVIYNDEHNFKVSTQNPANGFIWGNNITINGGIYTSISTTPIWLSSGPMNLINVTAECQNALVVTNRLGTLTINGGSYTSTNSTAIYNNRSGSLTIKNNPKVVTENGAALCSASGTVIIESGEFRGNGSYSDGYWQGDSSGNCAVNNWQSSKMIITGGTFIGTDGADAIINNGDLQLSNAVVSSKEGSALVNRFSKLKSGKYSATAEIISGTFQGSATGINLQSGSVTLGNANFSGNDTDIYLAADKQITIEDTFDDTATIKCADAVSDRQITTNDTTGQEKLNLISNDVDANGKTYLVAYDKDNNYRYLTPRAEDKYTVTAENATATLNGEPLYSYDQIEAGEEVTLTADTPEDGWEFAGWQVTEGDLARDDSADTVTFQMPASDVVVSAQYEYIGTPSDGADNIKGALSAVVVGAAAGAIIYETGTGIYRVINMPGIPMPSNRIELAELIWEHVGKPEPQSTEFYGDISEDDTDWQKAARWAVEQDLMQDDADNNEFHPYFPVSKLRVCLTWNAAKEKGLFDTDKTEE